MTETSFPVLEKPLNDQQWKSVTLGIGDGVFDEGGNPYNLVSKNNVNNTAVITVDSKKGYSHAILKGFYHKIDQNMPVTIPAVSSTTTFYITLVYDPLNKAMPVTLQVLTTLDRTSGKEYLVLWSVKRQANQLLTDAEFSKFRQTIVPKIQVDYAENLPDPKSVLFGTQAHCLYTGEDYRASYDSWKFVGNSQISPVPMAGWTYSNYSNGITLKPVKGGFECTWSTGITRDGNTLPIPTTWGNQYNVIGKVIPDGFAPLMNVHALALSNNTPLEARLKSTGVLEVRSTSGNTHDIFKGSGIIVTFTWYTDEKPNVRA